MRKRMAFSLSFILLLTGCTRVTEQVKPVSRDVFAMDTYMNLKVWAPDGEAVLDEAAEMISQLEKNFSVTIPDSEIAQINAAHGAPVNVSTDSAAVIGKALEIGDETDGALDISLYPVSRAWGFTTGTQRIPLQDELDALLEHVDYAKITLDGETVTVPDGMEIDIGAVAKGYTSDKLIALFRENGAESAIVSLGGNVQALGSKPDGSDWNVAVVNPFSPQENMCVLKIADQAVITSGNYERYFEDNGTRYHHIMDRSDGYPADNGLVSVTIIGDSGLTCDALSTALFVEGTERAIEYWKGAGDFEMILVTEDAKILYTEGISDDFENISSLPAEVISRE